MDKKKPIFDISMGGENWRELMGLDGEPWEKEGLTTKQRTSILREAGEANNPKAIKKILQLINEEKTLNTFPKWELGDGSKTEQIKMERGGWSKTPNGNGFYDKNVWRWDPVKQDLVGVKDGLTKAERPPVDINKFLITDEDIGIKSKTSIWDKAKGLGSKIIKNPLTKFGARVFGGTAAMVASELDWSNPGNYFMPKYEYNPENREIEKTIWE